MLGIVVQYCRGFPSQMPLSPFENRAPHPVKKMLGFGLRSSAPSDNIQLGKKPLQYCSSTQRITAKIGFLLEMVFSTQDVIQSKFDAQPQDFLQRGGGNNCSLSMIEGRVRNRLFFSMWESCFHGWTQSLASAFFCLKSLQFVFVFLNC